MGLPEGLQVYAENIFRRFPEEFIALGCPRLEDDFSLQSSTRRITDMGSSKSLEIVLRKGPMSPRADEPKPVVSSAQGTAALANQVTALHARLAMLERKDEPQDHGARGTLSTQDRFKDYQDQVPKLSPSGGSSTLASRRGKDVHVDVPVKPTIRPTGEASVAQAAVTVASSSPAEVSAHPKGTAKSNPKSDLNGRDQTEPLDKKGSGELSIRATRVMPTSDEPESPRSPGWFSAWGKS
jgi:hypothetical protein